MSDAPKPCTACPWTQKGQPDITPAILASAEAGDWFCCHVHMGTCYGAQGVARSAARKTDQGNG